MAGELSTQLQDLDGNGAGSSAETTSSTSTTGSNGHGSVHSAFSVDLSQDPLMLVPAGLFGNIVGSLAGTIGKEVGGWFGQKALGHAVGSAAGPLIKHFSPFQILPPQAAVNDAGPEEALMVVPAGFLTGLLGGVGGKIIGTAVGGLFGNKKLGGQIGSGTGGALGSIFGPFEVVAPQLAPQSSGPQNDQLDHIQDAMVLVPAGWLGHLFGGISGGVGQIIGGDTGKAVAHLGGAVGKLLPWQAVPPELAPASTGPDGGASNEELIVVPAGWLGNLASSFAGTIGSYAGRKLLNNAGVGRQLGEAASPLLRMIPYSVVPEELQPQSTGPDADNPEDKLVYVPASMLGGLLGSFGGLVSKSVTNGGRNNATVAGAADELKKFSPFQVLPIGASA
ncbi:hypothetical protein [Arthrobacter sp.]|uniref:hypothetical protein n=1 Tax=Arthrobacter sp. TaxID=1667 RepID=UPI0026DFF4D6|nr:hypothetical protein [Arthrobacter sp.]MDO5751717.1 hypothetical protein [Arthrobacter sp.]